MSVNVGKGRASPRVALPSEQPRSAGGRGDPSLDQSVGNYLTGVRDGAIVGGAGMLALATQDDRTIYAAPFIPFKERSAAMKFGGASLAAGGAVLAALWPSQPALQGVAVRPTHGGIRASRTFRW